MAQVTDVTKPSSGSPALLHPEEGYWKRYSPHHECLLSVVGSFTLHGLIFATPVLVALLFLLLPWNNAASRPLTTDVVQIAPGGDGFDEGGGAPAAGGPNQPKTEAVQNPAKHETKFAAANPDHKFKKLPETELDIEEPPEVDIGETPVDLAADLQKLKQDVDEAVKKAMGIAKAQANAGQTGAPNGKGGLGSSGPGTGKGNKPGPGTGRGGPGGRKATRQEILAHRWRFNLQGSGKEHADKLDMVGFILAVPRPDGKFLLVRELKRRPVDAKIESLAPFKDAIKWYNNFPQSISGLAQELQLPFEPQYVVLLLPKDREEKIAEAEQRYAKQNNRSAKLIRHTWFDFRFQNGVFEPLVLRQDYK